MPKALPVHRFSVVFTFSGPLGLKCSLLFGNRVVLTAAIISHDEHTQSNLGCFQTFDAVLPNDLFSDYFEFTVRS